MQEEERPKGEALLKLEFQEMRRNPSTSFTVCPTGPFSFLCWQGYVLGPKKSPYDGGLFRVIIKCAESYPGEAPEVEFHTKIHHPCICPTTGRVFYEPLQQEWDPSSHGLAHVMSTLLSLLEDPEAASEKTAENPVLDAFLVDREAFEKKAREWTETYAM